MLQRGDSVSHFHVKTLQREEFSYSTIWQRKNLILVTLPDPDSDSARSYVSGLTDRSDEFSRGAAECVITRDSVAGVPGPAALVADRWGEVVYVAATSEVEDLPRADELLDWLDYLQTRCPECEGEAK